MCLESNGDERSVAEDAFEQVLAVEEESHRAGRGEAVEIAEETSRSEGAELGRRTGRVIAGEVSYYRGLADVISGVADQLDQRRIKKSAQNLASLADRGLSRDDPEATLLQLRSQARLLFQQLGWDNPPSYPVADRLPNASGGLSF